MLDYDIPQCSNCKYNDIEARGGKRDEAKMTCYRCYRFDKFEPLEPEDWYDEYPWGRGD